MRLPFLLLLLSAIMLAVPVLADPLQNASRFGVDMRAGPGFQFPLIHVLDPGEVAERGRCDLDGKWCLLTAGGKVGWVDTAGLVPAGGGASELSRSDPIRPLRTDPVTSSVLGGGGSRPLPGAITDAVRGATDGPDLRTVPPGARVPFMFATDAPFYNVTDGLVNLRAGPGTANPVVAELRPGDGALIDICDAAQAWCRLVVDGRPLGWVKMTLVGLRRVYVAPLGMGDVAAR